MHRGERQIYEKTQIDPDLQDRSGRTKLLGNARLPDYIDWSKARARALSKPGALDHSNLNPSAAGLAGVDQDRRQQARRAVSVLGQDVAVGKGGAVKSERRHRISFLYFTRCRIVEILPAFASCPFRILEIAFEQFDVPHLRRAM
jgi:hypothetical protein